LEPWSPGRWTTSSDSVYLGCLSSTLSPDRPYAISWDGRLRYSFPPISRTCTPLFSFGVTLFSYTLRSFPPCRFFSKSLDYLPSLTGRLCEVANSCKSSASPPPYSSFLLSLTPLLRNRLSPMPDNHGFHCPLSNKRYTIRYLPHTSPLLGRRCFVSGVSLSPLRQSCCGPNIDNPCSFSFSHIPLPPRFSVYRWHRHVFLSCPKRLSL